MSEQLFHPDGTLRMECCPKCQHDRVQTTKWWDEDDPARDAKTFIFTQFCPDCWASWDRRVDGETAQAYSQVTAVNTRKIKFQIQDFEEFFKAFDFGRFEIWVERFCHAMDTDNICPDDF